MKNTIITRVLPVVLLICCIALVIITNKHG